MRIVSVKMPEVYVRILDEMVRSGLYASRGEAVRTAVRSLIREYLQCWRGNGKPGEPVFSSEPEPGVLVVEVVGDG
jgi:metal-responsive CopG/Arc/MetJ family transcriptional regulator